MTVKSNIFKCWVRSCLTSVLIFQSSVGFANSMYGIPLSEPKVWKIGGLHADYYTLAHDVKILGPTLLDYEDLESADAVAARGEYTRQIFGLIIQRAHQLVVERRNEGGRDNFSYWTFLVAALAVPHHESKLMHFRKVLAEKCNQSVNDMSLIKDQSVRSQFQSVYRNLESILFPDCGKFSNHELANQVIVSQGNHRDLGIMQISAGAWPIFAEPEYYFNISKFIQKGLEILYGHFEKLVAARAADSVAEVPTYECLIDRFFYNIIRGLWAGGYNTGNTMVGSTCRFKDGTNSDHQEYDRDFKSVLDALVFHKTSLYHKNLPENSLERRALDEIIENYHHVIQRHKFDEKRKAFEGVLSTVYILDPEKPFQIPNRAISGKKYFIKGRSVQLRLRPGTMTGEVCGVIENLNEESTPSIAVQGFFDEVDLGGHIKDRWAMAKVDKYASNVVLDRTLPHDIQRACSSMPYYFVYSNNLSEVYEGIAETFETVQAGLVIAGRSISIYDHYSINASTIGTLKNRTPVKVLGVIEHQSNGKWYKIELLDRPGQVGWVEQKYIRITKERVKSP